MLTLKRPIHESSRKSQGFTIVELLVVIVVIAILAAITIVSYNGIIQNASDTALKADLQQAASQVDVSAIGSGIYPSDPATINQGKGISYSSDTTLEYLSRGASYCITVSSDRARKSYMLDSLVGGIQQGVCSGHIGYGGSGTTSILTVSTLAGSGVAGYANGTGTAAQFNAPSGIDVDASGNVYVAEWNGARVRKITPAGVVSNLAGDGVSGHVNGVGTAARFKQPSGLTRTVGGDIFVADYADHRVRYIQTDTTAGDFVGSGSQGFLNATGTAAKLNHPQDVEFDSTETYMYIADYGNYRIRRVNSSGVVTTFAGSGTQGHVDNSTGTSAQFSGPIAVAFDSAGNVYVSDNGGATNCYIRKITSSGSVSTLAGSSTCGFADGNGASAQFNDLVGLAVDASGNIYVADAGNNRIRKVTPSGNVSTLAGTGVASSVNGSEQVATFNYPNDIAIDTAGNLYIAEGNGNLVRKITFN